MSGAPAAAVVVPAKDEEERVGATVAAVAGIPGVDLVVVVDDGSRDDTAGRARAAGAVVVRHTRNRGKAAAMETGAAAVELREQQPGEAGGTARALMFVDADLGSSAAGTAPLLEPVLAGRVDMTIATLPPQETPGGGRGLVVTLSRNGIVALTGWTPTQPLSGMRALTRQAFEAARPLAQGWGVETALTVDLLTAGYRVEEVECDLHHRVTGTDLRAQLHRARQYRDVWRALAVRRWRARSGRGLARRGPIG